MVSGIWEMKTGKRQKVSVDTQHSAATLNSTLYMQAVNLDGKFEPVESKNHEAMLAITQLWPTKDGRYLLAHSGLPNLKEGVLGVLGCYPTPV